RAGAPLRLENNGVAREPVAAYLEMEPAVRRKKHSGDMAFSHPPRS
ncbi:MAG: hypothetical protein V7604_4828, partial [Hyphomicrobiales bacterium]